MTLPSIVQSRYGTGAGLSLLAAPTAGNVVIAVPLSVSNDTWSRDERDGGFCPVDARMTLHGKAGSNFFRSSGANSCAILSKTIAADLYAGPWRAGPNCDGGGTILLIEVAGLVVNRARVNLIQGVGSDGAGAGSFALGFTGVRPGSFLVMAAAMKRDGYGGSPAVDVAPNGFTELVDGANIVNGWTWAGTKIDSGDAAISYNTHDGPFEGWGAIAVLLEPPALNVFPGDPGGSVW